MSLLKVVALLGTLFYLTGCGPAGEGSELSSDDSTSLPIPESNTASAVAGLEGCYRMVIKNDTAGLQLNIKNDSVTGRLYYHWAERDHNNGEISGVIKDSQIYANYRFQSEGITSVREVIFRFRGDTLYQAYGEVLPINDTVRFRLPEHVIFDRKNPFVRVACADSLTN